MHFRHFSDTIRIYSTVLKEYVGKNGLNAENKKKFANKLWEATVFLFVILDRKNFCNMNPNFILC